MLYLLDKNNEVVHTNDVTLWGEQFNDIYSRQVAEDNPLVGIRVSTVFLGIDHGLTGGTPLLFETIVFGGEQDQEQERYHTYEEAVLGHARMLVRIIDSENRKLEIVINLKRQAKEAELKPYDLPARRIRLRKKDG